MPTSTRSVVVVVAGQPEVWLCCVVVTCVVGATGAPQEALVKPSFEPGRDAGSLSSLSARPFLSGCEPVVSLCAWVQAVYGMLITTYGFDSEPVRWQTMTWWCALADWLFADGAAFAGLDSAFFSACFAWPRAAAFAAVDFAAVVFTAGFDSAFLAACWAWFSAFCSWPAAACGAGAWVATEAAGVSAFCSCPGGVVAGPFPLPLPGSASAVPESATTQSPRPATRASVFT